ncbi:trans-aconitate 2-methyltransferase [Cladophialophora yegresii CBS 114405]|uniref:Trans-aconitate 2-methyltransferase n=1 Tax=Cladophialophora yegresii CBS 114405 TaxID=1182544 RepID=W9VF52_9EURO|nr:trans-aconitate 2-methyltransferase [Cladophialophora yegresii CBS 114405]EXJ54103.1 trans-aconitate 2-methyltransferase [Cladophialophora yegresii CBS 114405]
MDSHAKDWNATQYLKFEAERTRPARDLVAQIPLTSPAKVLDLGCGPGNSTAVLATHFPNAHITGVDSSPDMIAKASARLPGVEFKLGDLRDFAQPAPRPQSQSLQAGPQSQEQQQQQQQQQVVFSNAVFQWLPHDSRMQILEDLLAALHPGDVFAFQVPDNFDEPTHVAMRETADEGPWAETLRPVTTFRRSFQSPRELYDRLSPLCRDGALNVWHTHYYHVLDDAAAIVEWVKGTGLRPYVDKLSPLERNAFLKEYLSRVERAYPPLADGKVCLRYPRLFVVAVRA